MSDNPRTQFREDYPYIGARNWRYKQEVSETVADHLTSELPNDKVNGIHISEALHRRLRYRHPFVRPGMDWFGLTFSDSMAYTLATQDQPRSNVINVNGWSDREEFERLAGDQVLWISQPTHLDTPQSVKRNSGQHSADLEVAVSMAGMLSRSVGLFAEVTFTTSNQYVSYVDAMILGKIDPDTGEVETPYHALGDDVPNKEFYKGCRPKDGTLFIANRMAHFILDACTTEPKYSR